MSVCTLKWVVSVNEKSVECQVQVIVLCVLYNKIEVKRRLDKS